MVNEPGAVLFDQQGRKRAQFSPSDECVICLERLDSMEAGALVFVAHNPAQTTFHPFHEPCIKGELEYRKLCPICRGPIASIHKVEPIGVKELVFRAEEHSLDIESGEFGNIDDRVIYATHEIEGIELEASAGHFRTAFMVQSVVGMTSLVALIGGYSVEKIAEFAGAQNGGPYAIIGASVGSLLSLTGAAVQHYNGMRAAREE